MVDVFKVAERIIEERLKDLKLYSEEQIRQLVQIQQWKGEGTEHDPFIVDNSKILGQKIRIKKCSLYISFMNCDFDHILFEQCKNIILDNCSIKQLDLSGCKRFKIESSSISDLHFTGTKIIYFNNCKILKITSFLGSKRYIFDNCQVKENPLESFEGSPYGQYYSIIKKSLPLSILIFGTYVLYKVFYDLYTLNSLNMVDIILIVSLILLLGSFLYFLIFNYRQKKDFQKIISNNSHK